MNKTENDVLMKFHQRLIDEGLAPKDQRVYLVIDMANAVLAGQDLSFKNREALAEFPYTLALMDRMVTLRGGGVTRVHASPGPDATAESFAKAWLAIDWEIEHGRSYRTEVLDQMWEWRWRRISAWLGDRLREIAMETCVLWNRKVLRIVNPYT